MMNYKDRYNVACNLIDKGYLIHSTDASFDNFDKGFIKGGSRAREGYGFYFSDMPYKCIDYGDNLIIIKKNDFNFLELSDEIDLGWFSDEDIRYNIAKLEYMLDGCRSNREYDMYSSEIEKLEDELRNYDSDLLMYVKEAIKQGARNYGQLEYYMNDPQVNVPKLIKVYLNKGYDGGHYDGIYTVFNFDKLNEKFIRYEAMSEGEMLIKHVVNETVREYLRHNLVK